MVRAQGERIADEGPAPAMHPLVTALLLAMVFVWVVTLTVAATLYPYDLNGEALQMETHRQLGLPPCTIKQIYDIPCPSCGMTTSFSLLMHGDVWNSLKANFAGTALAFGGLLFIPWALASAFLSRFVWVRSIELLAFKLTVSFLALLLVHWGYALWMNQTW